ncbi:MAG: mannose-6-phosphate isomerase, class I [Micromonosporaceae bacterium]
MEPLRGRIRPYEWGSRTVIAELQGRPVPSPQPEAELWLGAHDSDPSTVDREGRPVSLLDLIAADPQTVLGAPVVERFGPRLPYLLKVLAAEEPLSLQAHPDAERARQRYAAGDPNYVDPHHKPELLVAASDFEALCGFRAPEESAQLLRKLEVPALAPVVSVLEGAGPAGERLRAATTMLLDWPADQRAALVAAVGSSACRSADPDCAFVAGLADRYAGDVGVVVALLLNRVALRPGQAVWMPAGNLHAYLRGTGIEIMAASDNVLRGGLTPKRVDVAELLRVLRFEVLAEPVLRPVEIVAGAVTWPVPVTDFALYRVTPAGSTAVLPVPGPRVVLCLSGEVTLDDGAGAFSIGRGESAFGAGTAGPLEISGDGVAYVATPGPTWLGN